MEKKFDSYLYKPIIITVDGTAASGKGTVVNGLKNHLDKRYKTMDAGLMYRGLTYYYINKNIDANKLKLKKDLENILSNNILINLSNSGGIILNGEEIDEIYLRGPEIDPFVGKFAAINEVKEYIVSTQKKIVEENENVGWILDGRCMGSAVVPQAQVKFYMDAPLLVRATRRHLQYEKLGKTGYSTEEIKIDLEKRDEQDKCTLIAPLIKPEDSYDLNSYKYSSKGVINKTLTIVERAIIENGLL